MAVESPARTSWEDEVGHGINFSDLPSRRPTLYEVLLELENHTHKSFEHRISSLITVWTCLSEKAHALQQIRKLFPFIYRESALTVFSGHWLQVSPTYKRGLACALTQCSQRIESLLSGSAGLCSALVMNIYDPWGDPGLCHLLECKDIDQKLIADYIESEPHELLLIRIECLVNANLDEVAIQLCRSCLRSKHSFSSRNSEEDEFKIDRDCWKWSFLEWMMRLLFRRGKLSELVAESSICTCHDGVRLIHRLWHCDKAESEALTETLINLFLIRDLLFPTHYCCTRELMKLWCEFQILKRRSVSEIQDTAQKLLVVHASTSAHFYLFVDILWEQYGISLLPLYLEMYIRGLTSDLNFLEAARQAEAQESVLEMETHMASIYYKLSSLFSSIDKDVSRECMLSAFSLDPTKERLELIQKLSRQIDDEKSLRHGRTMCSKNINQMKPPPPPRPQNENLNLSKLNSAISPLKSLIVTRDQAIQVGDSSYLNPDELSGTVSESVKSNQVDKKEIDSDKICKEKANTDGYVSKQSDDGLKKDISNVVNAEIIEHESDCEMKSKNLNEKCSTEIKNKTENIEHTVAAITCSINGNYVQKNKISENVMYENNSEIQNETEIIQGNIFQKYDEGNACESVTDGRTCLALSVKDGIDSITELSEKSCPKNLINAIDSGDKECSAKEKDFLAENTQSIYKVNSCNGNELQSENSSLAVTENPCSCDTDDIHLMNCVTSTSKVSCNIDEKTNNVDDVTANNVHTVFNDCLLPDSEKTLQKNVSDTLPLSLYFFSHVIIDSKIPDIHPNLLNDFVTVLESLRNRHLKCSGRWKEIRRICENYLETFSVLRSMLLQMCYNSGESEIDSASENSVCGNKQLGSQHSNESIFRDCRVDKTVVMKRFINHPSSIQSRGYVNLSDIYYPHFPLDKLLCMKVPSSHGERQKGHRRHRNREKDPTKNLLRKLRHDVDYDKEIFKRKRKKKRKAKKEKSHNLHSKKHHSSRKGARDFLKNKKKRHRLKKKKENKLDLASGDFCSDISSTELLKLVNEHTNILSGGDVSGLHHSSKHPHVSSIPFCPNTNILSDVMSDEPSTSFKKKKKQVSFVKMKEKKSKFLKGHSKHLKHSRSVAKLKESNLDSKRSKTEMLIGMPMVHRQQIPFSNPPIPESVNSEQEYPHLVQFSSVKQMQAVRIHQSSVTLDLSEMTAVNKEPQNSLSFDQHANSNPNVVMQTSLKPPLQTCSNEDIVKMQMLVSKQHATAPTGGNVLDSENFQYIAQPSQDLSSTNNQSVLKYVCSKMTSHMLSVAQASKCVVVPKCGTESLDYNKNVKSNVTSSSRQLGNVQPVSFAAIPTKLNESSQHLVCSKPVIPGSSIPQMNSSVCVSVTRSVPVCSSPSELYVSAGPSNLPANTVVYSSKYQNSPNSPQVTAFTIPIAQNVQDGSGNKIFTGKLVIPLNNCTSVKNSVPTNRVGKLVETKSGAVVSSSMGSGNQPFTLPGVIIVKNGSQNPQISICTQQQPNMTVTEAQLNPMTTQMSKHSSPMSWKKSYQKVLLPRTGQKATSAIQRKSPHPSTVSRIRKLVNASRPPPELTSQQPSLVISTSVMNEPNIVSVNSPCSQIQEQYPGSSSAIDGPASVVESVSILSNCDPINLTVTSIPLPVAPIVSTPVNPSTSEICDSMDASPKPSVLLANVDGIVDGKSTSSIPTVITEARCTTPAPSSESSSISSVIAEENSAALRGLPVVTSGNPISLSQNEMEESDLTMPIVQSDALNSGRPSSANEDDPLVDDCVGSPDVIPELPLQTSADQMDNVKDCNAHVNSAPQLTSSEVGNTTVFTSASYTLTQKSAGQTVPNVVSSAVRTSICSVTRVVHTSQSDKQLQPLMRAGIQSGVRPPGVVNTPGRIEGTSHVLEVPTRSLTSISDAVRFSLMDMDDATGAVENQVLQTFQTFPSEASGYLNQVSANFGEGSITPLTSAILTSPQATSTDIGSVQTSQTFQSSLRTSQRETFSDCHMTVSSTTEWVPGSTDVSPGSSQTCTSSLCKLHETDSANESKDEDIPKKKRKKKVKTDRATALELQRRFWCEICLRGFFSAYNLRRHCRNVHKMNFPRGTSDSPFTIPAAQVCTHVTGDGTTPEVSPSFSSGQQSGVSSSSPEFHLQSPCREAKNQEFVLQSPSTIPPNQIQQTNQITSMNLSQDFVVQSPPRLTSQTQKPALSSSVTPPKEFHIQSPTTVSSARSQQCSKISPISKSTQEFSMQSSPCIIAQGQQSLKSEQVPLGLHSTQPQATRQLQSGRQSVQKPGQILSTGISQPQRTCQSQRAQPNAQCEHVQRSKQLTSPSVITAQVQQVVQVPQIHHSIQVHQMHQPGQAAHQIKKCALAQHMLTSGPVQQIQQAGQVAHIQQIQKLTQIQQGGSQDFTVQAVRTTGSGTATAQGTANTQFFLDCQSSASHHAHARQNAASVYRVQAVQDTSRSDLFSQALQQTNAGQTSCTHNSLANQSPGEFSAGGNPIYPSSRLSSEASDGLEDLEQFLLENMPWSGDQSASQNLSLGSTHRPSSADSLTLSIPTQTPHNAVIHQKKISHFSKNKPSPSKTKIKKISLGPSSKNLLANKGSGVKKKVCIKKSVKSIERSISDAEHECLAASKFFVGEKKLGCQMKTNQCIGAALNSTLPLVNAAPVVSYSINENDSSDSVQCIKITHKPTHLKDPGKTSVISFSNACQLLIENNPKTMDLSSRCNGQQNESNSLSRDKGIAAEFPKNSPPPITEVTSETFEVKTEPFDLNTEQYGAKTESSIISTKRVKGACFAHLQNKTSGGCKSNIKKEANMEVAEMPSVSHLKALSLTSNEIDVKNNVEQCNLELLERNIATAQNLKPLNLNKFAENPLGYKTLNFEGKSDNANSKTSIELENPTEVPSILERRGNPLCNQSISSSSEVVLSTEEKNGKQSLVSTKIKNNLCDNESFEASNDAFRTMPHESLNNGPDKCQIHDDSSGNSSNSEKRHKVSCTPNFEMNNEKESFEAHEKHSLINYSNKMSDSSLVFNKDHLNAAFSSAVKTPEVIYNEVNRNSSILGGRHMDSMNKYSEGNMNSKKLHPALEKSEVMISTVSNISLSNELNNSNISEKSCHDCNTENRDIKKEEDVSKKNISDGGDDIPAVISGQIETLRTEQLHDKFICDDNLTKENICTGLSSKSSSYSCKSFSDANAHHTAEGMDGSVSTITTIDKDGTELSNHHTVEEAELRKEEGCMWNTKDCDNLESVVLRGRSRLRDAKASIKRTCPCCDQSCPPKRCRASSEGNSSGNQTAGVKNGKALSPSKSVNSNRSKILPVLKTRSTNGSTKNIPTRSSQRPRTRSSTIMDINN